MPWAAYKHSDLFERIHLWKQEVVRNTIPSAPTVQSPPTANCPHHMKLRSQTTPQALAEVSGNPSSRKRKASNEIMDADASRFKRKANKDKNLHKDSETLKAEAGETIQQREPPRRGRPKNIPEPKPTLESQMVLQSRVSPSLGLSSGSAKPRTTAKSPSKRGQLALETPTPNSGIDMKYLSRCTPPVRLTTFSELAFGGSTISLPVQKLKNQLQDVPLGLIPSALKVTSP